MKRNEIIERATEYILRLQDKTNIDMEQVVAASCPENTIDDINVLDYRWIDDIKKSVEKKGTMVLDFSSHDGKCEGLPFRMDFFVREKYLRKVQIISDLLCYGPKPSPDDPVEQRLTVSSSGRVWFTEYLYGEYPEKKYCIGRRIQRYIGEDSASYILSMLRDLYEEGTPEKYCTDIGNWDMNLTYMDGTRKCASGSMCGGIIVDDVDLADYIRRVTWIENLSIFGGTVHNYQRGWFYDEI